jgi:hypothetical protein
MPPGAVAFQRRAPAWSDEAAVLVGAGRVDPDEQQRDEIASVAQRLPVLD